MKPPLGSTQDYVQAIVVGAYLMGRRELSHQEASRVLEAYGIPVWPGIHVQSPHAAIKAASDLGYPVSIKLSLAGPTPRIITGIEEPAALRDALMALYDDALADDPHLGFVVQHCPDDAAGPDVESGFEPDVARLEADFPEIEALRLAPVLTRAADGRRAVLHAFIRLGSPVDPS